MKSTIVLFCIALGLGIFSYIHEELGDQKAREEKQKKEQLFDPAKLGNLIGFETSKVKISLKDGFFVIGEESFPVDDNKLNALFEYLSGIKVARVFKPEEKNQIDEKLTFKDEKSYFIFKFDKSNLKFLIGEKVEFGKEFYVKIELPDGKEKIALAYDSTPETKPVDREKYRLKPHQYQKLKNTLGLSENFFYETKVFREDRFRKKLNQIAKLSVKNLRNRDFTVNLNEETTQPKIIPNLKYNKHFFKEFRDKLYKLRGGSVFLSYDRKLLKDRLSTVVIEEIDGKKIELELFKKYGSLSGYFLISDKDKNLYECSSDVLNIFFSNYQSFWDKRIFAGYVGPGMNLDGKKRENFKIKFKKGSAIDLAIPLSKSFLVEYNGEKQLNRAPNNIEFSKLFAFMWNQADRVQDVDREDSSLIENYKMLLTYENQEIVVSQKDGELVFLHKQGNFKLNYYVGSKSPISLEERHYFIGR